MTIKKRSNWWRILPYLWPQWPLITKGLLCILGFVFITLCLPYLAGRVALFIGKGEVEKVAYWLGLGTLAFLVRGVFQYGQNIFMIDAALIMGLNPSNSYNPHRPRKPDLRQAGQPTAV